MKKQEETVTHDLRDRPVPPVKGCIVDREPARPEAKQASGDLGFLNRLQ